jgi:DNA-binding PadR family transcriptional regulator
MFGPHFYKYEKRSRLFEKGDLKYVILELLREKPRHGYEIIRALEERFQGFYTPSAGSVYPTLQMLEDMGYVRPVESEGKKVFEITEQGKEFLTEQGEAVNRIKGHIKSWMGPQGFFEFHEAMHDLRSTRHLLRRRMHSLSTQQMERIKEVISRACREIEDIVEKQTK